MNMTKIGIIINPHSKRIKQLKTNPVEYYKRIGGDFVDIRLTKTLDDITKAARDFKKKGILYLAISGGDGSIHSVISKFINVYKDSAFPAVLVLRDGSMNNIARSYNLKGKGPVLLQKLINAINNNKKISIVYRTTIKVKEMYCFLFGLGITTNFINEFNKGGDKSPWKAVKVALRTISGIIFNFNPGGLFNRMKLKVYVDGKELWFNDFLGIFAATIENLAISFRPTPRAYEKENTFHLIASGMKPSELLFKINKFRKGIPIKNKYHYDNIASELKIISPVKFSYQMDGDVYESDKELTAQAGPRIGFIKL